MFKSVPVAIAVAAASGVLASSVSSDESRCSAEPTRACVMAMAVQMAEWEVDGVSSLQDMMKIAALAHQSGVTDSEAVFARLIDELERREPDLLKRSNRMAESACGVGADWTPGGQRLAELQVDYLNTLIEALPTDAQIDGGTPRAALRRCLGVLGRDDPKPAESVYLTSLDHTWRYGLRKGRHFERLLALPQIPKVRADLEGWIEREIVRADFREDFTTGVAAIEALPGADQQLMRLSDALDFAKSEADHALLIPVARSLASSLADPLPPILIDILARPATLAGDWDETLRWIDRLETGPSSGSSASKALARLSGTVGAFDVVDALLDSLGTASRKETLEAILDAVVSGALSAEHPGFPDWIADLPDHLRVDLYVRIADYWIAQGDADRAKTALGDLADLNRTGREVRFVTARLVPLLAKERRVREAVGLARNLADGPLLAQVALMLD